METLEERKERIRATREERMAHRLDKGIDGGRKLLTFLIVTIFIGGLLWLAFASTVAAALVAGG